MTKTTNPTKSRMPPGRPALVGVLFGWALDRLWPWSLGPYRYVLPAGVVLAALFVACAVACALAFKRHGTSADEKQETRTLLVSGPYRFSRNPAYVALALLQASLGLLFNSVWILLMAAAVLLFIHHVVVLKEEAYLEARFGDSYRDYKSRVRRWL